MTLADLYHTYAAELRRYCASRVGQDLADAVGDLWLRAVRAWPRYQERGEGRAWLYTIARNVCVDTLRRESRTLPLDALGDVVSAPDAFSDVDAVIDARSLLAPLPARQARALWLTACGYRQTEAAGMLGVSVLGFKALLHRGRAAV
ncbi:MAG TPA: RNA polymerase sigma factor [Roseiflexaceae bacterium]|nr:RNA polymerase sigma factor [Roseiflexaceae bacterium]